MKNLVLIVSIFCVLSSCNQDKNTTQTTNKSTQTPVKTTPEKPANEKIDSYVNTIKIVKNLVTKDNSFSKNEIKYDIQAAYLDSLLVKMSANYTDDNYQKEENYYIRNGALVMYNQHRVSIVEKEGELAKVSDTKVYLENYKIIKVLEKSKESKPGGNLSLMDEYFVPIEVNADSLHAELNKQLNFFKGKL